MWDVGLSDNTVAKYLKTLKTIVRFYINKGEINYFELSSIASKEREGSIYVLSIKQILHLQNLNVENEALSNARDVFCFMCWTGQRYSDIEKIKRDDIIKRNGDLYWEFITSKTSEPIQVPLLEYAVSILKKYEDEDMPLPVVSNQKMNDHLKILGKKADFNEAVKVIQYFDGREQESYLPFHEILTTHVARKSYITNSLTLGVPERVVREISGHKDEKSFARYVKLAESYKNKVIQNAFSEENISKFV
jgi:integrase